MLTSLRRALHAYGALERRVTALLSLRFASCCASCSGDCCDADICRESVESDWLRLLVSISGERGGSFDPDQGWRSPRGCRLPIGRPPICYEFFCQKAVDSLPDDRHREHLKTAAALVNDVGKQALGGRHLVTLTAAEIFGRLNIDRLNRRLQNALGLLNDIATLLGEPLPWAVPAQRFEEEIPILLLDVIEEG